MLSHYEKVEYKRMRDEIESVFKGQLISIKSKGITLLTVPASPAPDFRFYHLAVSYCSPGDKWNKKRGIYEVLRKYYSGQFISIPAGLKLALNHNLFELLM